ncbi:MAG: peptide chain release factor N(5)-glutamine methyltransferase [Candidatus Omnitrophica bacterium]|nr:peptide chain release factor N(5)-glutamine methyltransferase [Candidatus Omnitrophota bacterium]
MFDKFMEIYGLFEKQGFADPLLETLRLFNLASKGELAKVDLLFLKDKEINLDSLIQKRKQGVPLEYIMGEAVFMGNLFFCTQDTLIPTEYTKLLVNTALDFIKKRQESENRQTLIDMGTGCGNIAISIAMHSNNTKVLASDLSNEAVAIARNNVNRFNLQEKVSLFCGDLFFPFQNEEYAGKVDIVVCNPPYIPTSSLSKMAPEIVNFEPHLALDAGPYGINIFRRVITDALLILKPKGILCFEIGLGQEKLVGRLLEKNENYEQVEYYKDQGLIRVISAVKKG